MTLLTLVELGMVGVGVVALLAMAYAGSWISTGALTGGETHRVGSASRTTPAEIPYAPARNSR